VNPTEVFSRIWAAFDACETVVACAWCGQVRLGSTWFKPPAGLMDAIDGRLTLSHSICEECAEAYPSTAALG
jgi:hypothetical protein